MKRDSYSLYSFSINPIEYGLSSQNRNIHNTNKRIKPRNLSKEPKGVILLMVLVLLGLIVSLALYLELSAHIWLREARCKNLHTQLYAAATDAAWSSLHLLSSDDNLTVDHTNECWATPVRHHLPNGIETVAEIIDAQQFFDANNLSAKLSDKKTRPHSMILKELLIFCGEQDPLAQTQALENWFLHAPNISKQESPLEVHNSFLESPDELLKILGSKSASGKLLNYLTVLPRSYPKIVPVNLNTAGRDVLLAVFGTGNFELVDWICAIRQQHPFASLALVEKRIGTEHYKKYKHYLDVKTSFFFLRTMAEQRGAASAGISALIFRNECGQVNILRWITT